MILAGVFFAILILIKYQLRGKDAFKQLYYIPANALTENAVLLRPHTNLSSTFPQREKCPNPEFFWSIFSHIWTEYGDLLAKSQYSARMREQKGQKKLQIQTHSAQCFLSLFTILKSLHVKL